MLALRRDEAVANPLDFDFSILPGLSAEVRTQAGSASASDTGPGARIDGITPAALMILLSRLKRPTYGKREA